MLNKKLIYFLLLILLFFTSTNLSFGNGIKDVRYEWVSNDTNYDCDLSGAINIGDKIKFIIELSNITSSTDTAMIDIGTLYQNIQLYNDGTHGDTMTSDQFFTVIWTLKEGTSVNDAVIKGIFWDNGVAKEKYSDQTLSFDAERPIINNINISPNAFNPYIESCEIAYTISETVNNVVVKIYNDFTLTNLVKELPKAPTESGDNFVTWWDGKNDSGNFEQIPPDKDYYIYISCKDLSGNYSEPFIATVKVSTVRIEIISLDLTPTPVSPNNDGVNDNLYVNMKLMMYSWDGANKKSITTNQMANLGFTAGSNWPGNSSYADGDLFHTWPYAKAGFSIYDATGNNLLKVYSQDLNSEYDFDQFYATMFSNQLGGIQPDGDPQNDYETLVPFYDDGTHEIDYTGGGPQSGDGIFSTSYSFMIKLDGNWNNGVYILKAGIELTGINYSIIPGDPNTVHFSPDWKGGYINSSPKQATFEVDMGDISEVDFTPPTVSSVTPSDGSEITYRISSVSAYIEDNFGGSGVDMLNSDIYLTDSDGNKIPGRKINDGANLIIWELEQPLSKSGKYYIYVLPVDKRNNQPSEYLKFSFDLNIIDDTANLITVVNGGTVVDEKNRVCLEVPSYAVEQDIRISVYKPYSFPGEDTVYSGCRFSPDTISFKRPVKLTIYYTDQDKANLPSGISEAALRIYNWKNNKWEYIGGNVDINNMCVNVEGIRRIEGYYALLPETYGGLPSDIISDVEVDKPFRENSYISFKVSSSIKDIKLLIYSLKGTFIKELSLENGLIKKIENAGYYRVLWDLTTEDAGIVNNGIYIFRFIVKKDDGATKIVSKAIPVIK